MYHKARYYIHRAAGPIRHEHHWLFYNESFIIGFIVVIMIISKVLLTYRVEELRYVWCVPGVSLDGSLLEVGIEVRIKWSIIYIHKMTSTPVS